jgi:hypothetical protein
LILNNHRGKDGTVMPSLGAHGKSLNPVAGKTPRVCIDNGSISRS